MILIGNNTLIAQKNDNGVPFVMAAVLCAAFDRAKPITDDEKAVHPAYKPDDRLTMAEALRHVQSGNLLTVLFLRGRQVMLHMRPGRLTLSVQVSDEIVDEPWPPEMFQEAQKVLRKTEHCPRYMH